MSITFGLTPEKLPHIALPLNVAEILSNETYAGAWHYGKNAKKNGEWVRNPQSYWLSLEVPAIVSCETWQSRVSCSPPNQ